MRIKLGCLLLATALCLPLSAQQVYNMARFGITPGKKSNMAARMERALAKIKKRPRKARH